MTSLTRPLDQIVKVLIKVAVKTINCASMLASVATENSSTLHDYNYFKTSSIWMEMKTWEAISTSNKEVDK